MLISHVCQKRRLPRIMINLFAHMTVKVTIGTFGYAKGPMDIKRKPLPIRSLCGYCRGGGVKRHYERSGLIKTGFYQFVERIGAVAHLVLVLWVQSEEHTSELQSRENLVCRLLLEKKQQLVPC